MPLKKSELYASLWKICDGLRGGMDASQYKGYMLVLFEGVDVTGNRAEGDDLLGDVWTALSAVSKRTAGAATSSRSGRYCVW